MPNIQVTHDGSQSHGRNESSIAINPLHPRQMVAASKHFTDPAAYRYTLATSWSNDGGQTWRPSGALSVLPAWSGIRSPKVAWDNAGHVFLVASPFTYEDDGAEIPLGVVVYRSTNGGHSWGPPNFVKDAPYCDRPVLAADTGNHFPGHVYAVWAVRVDDGVLNVGLTRSTDHGVTWHQVGSDATHSDVEFSYVPVMDVAASNGNIYIAWVADHDVMLLVSKDGGDTFLPASVAASGITTLDEGIPSSLGWKVFPGGNFVVSTQLTVCAGAGDTVSIAWADYRHGVSRIYHALSQDAGLTWATLPAGSPLIKVHHGSPMQHFQPQLAAEPGGVIGCAFYEYGPKPTIPKIDTKFAWSLNGGLTFPHMVTVTDHPWDPTVDAPQYYGNTLFTSIGEYLGLGASSLGFYPLWTDSRTGIEELFTTAVKVHSRFRFDRDLFTAVEEILFGVTQDGGGAVLIGGHVHRVPPYDPEGPVYDILLALANQRIASQIQSPEGIALQKAAMHFVATVAIRETQRLEGAEASVSEVEPKVLTEAGTRS